MLIQPGPVDAQIPDLLPNTTTTAPGGTTTTLLPALIPEDALKPAPPPSGDEQPAPAPAPSLLPVPAPAPAPTTSRTTIFVPTPVAMRSTGRSTATTVPKKARSTTTATTDVPEAVPEPDEPVQATLPYKPTGGDEATVDGEMELGVQSLGGDSVTSWASAAAGLLAAVLLGVIVWIQRQVRRRPAGPGDLEPGW